MIIKTFAKETKKVKS